MTAGVPKGPMVGEVLREVEDWWIDHDFIDDQMSAIEKLKSVGAGDGVLKLGILKTGRPPSSPRSPQFGTYPDMFRRLLGEDAYDYAVYRGGRGRAAGQPRRPATPIWSPARRRASTSRCPWIGRLKDFLHAAKGQAALVGVCFGHQVMAQAFGGKVIKSPKGWGLGEQEYAC